MRVLGRLRQGAVLGTLFLSVIHAAFAQDERRVTSPNGQLEFRIYIAPQHDYALNRLAYQISFNGKTLIEMSYIGIDLWDQEPILGETVGLGSSSTASNARYNSLRVNYLQNGSIGRRIDIEVRAYDGGIAFRYIIPHATPLVELLIADESTEFALTKNVIPPPQLPLVTEVPGAGWMEITEVPAANFPAMHLAHEEGAILLTRLARNSKTPDIVYEGTTPFTFPWRVVLAGADRAKLGAGILEDLKR